MSYIAHMISVRVSAELEKQSEEAAELVGLKISDLVRIGLQRVNEEIFRTKKLRIAQPSSRKAGKGAK